MITLAMLGVFIAGFLFAWFVLSRHYRRTSATLSFNLPDERPEFMSAVRGASYEGALCELDEWLRTQIKHSDKEEWQPVRDKFWELMQERNLDLWGE